MFTFSLFRTGGASGTRQLEVRNQSSVCWKGMVGTEGKEGNEEALVGAWVVAIQGDVRISGAEGSILKL